MGMMDAKQPTQEDLADAAWDDHEDFEEVERKDAANWRHGATVTQVLKRLSDGTFWRVIYRLSTDGEYNGIREGDYSVARVQPTEVVSIKYVPYVG